MRDIINAIAHPIKETEFRAFHGTAAEFTAFDEQKPRHISSYRLGFYFTDSPRHAEAYARARNGPNPRVIEVSLTMDQPLDIHALTDREVIDILPLPVRAKQELGSAFRGKNGEQYGLLEAGVRFGLRDALRAEGYDGIIYREGPGVSYIVFAPDQVQTIRTIAVQK